MTTKKWPPIDPGTVVQTTKPNWEKRREWTDEAWVITTRLNLRS